MTSLLSEHSNITELINEQSSMTSLLNKQSSMTTLLEDHRHHDCHRTFANTNALNVNDDGIASLEETNHKQQRHASV